MLRNQIISIEALAVIGLALPTGAFAPVEVVTDSQAKSPPARRRVFNHKAPPEALMYNGSNANLRRFR